MSKINMIKKKKEWGSQYVIFNPHEHDILGTNETEGIEELIIEKINLGHAIFHYGNDEFFLLYVSKDVDGFTRKVTEGNWTIDMAINVFEKSQTVWEANIDAWFDIALEKEEFKAELRAIIAPAMQLVPIKGNKPFNVQEMLAKIDIDDPKYAEKAKLSAREWLKNQKITKNGTSGKRKQSPWNFMCGNGKQYGRPSAWIKKAVDYYVYKNTEKKFTKGSWKK
jgi:hypothetical protein